MNRGSLVSLGRGRRTPEWAFNLPPLVMTRMRGRMHDGCSLPGIRGMRPGTPWPIEVASPIAGIVVETARTQSSSTRISMGRDVRGDRGRPRLLLGQGEPISPLPDRLREADRPASGLFLSLQCAVEEPVSTSSGHALLLDLAITVLYRAEGLIAGNGGHEFSSSRTAACFPRRLDLVQVHVGTARPSGRIVTVPKSGSSIGALRIVPTTRSPSTCRRSRTRGDRRASPSTPRMVLRRPTAVHECTEPLARTHVCARRGPSRRLRRVAGPARSRDPGNGCRRAG